MVTSAQIAQATPLKLICLTYERLLEDLKEASTSNGKERKEKIKHAREIILELTSWLNFEVELAGHLFSLYIYIQNSLINHSEDSKKLEVCYQLIYKIYEGYKVLEEEQYDDEVVVENAEKIYSGMTYGKGYLNEVVVGSSNRGIKA